MSARFSAVVPFGVTLLLAVSSLAQPLPKALAPVNNSDSSTSTTDPLGRETPAGTVIGFLQACQSANYKTAAQYLDLPARKQSEGPEIAMQLKALIDTSGANVSLKRISTRPEGDMQEGVAFDRQPWAHLLQVTAKPPCYWNNKPNHPLARFGTSRPIRSKRFLSLYDQIQAHEIEKKLPTALVENEFVGLALWQWFALLLALPLSAAIAWLLIKVFQVPRTLYARRKGLPIRRLWKNTSWPLWLLLATLVDRILVAYIGVPSCSAITTRS